MALDSDLFRIVGSALREAAGRDNSHLPTWAWVLSRVKSIRADIPDSEILQAVVHLHDPIYLLQLSTRRAWDPDLRVLNECCS